MVERRRCKRFPFTIPVKVYGRTPRNHPFRDVTATMAVSLYGGLLDMKPRVKLGQKILIVNSFTEEERECRVVYVDSKAARPKEGRGRIRKTGWGFLARLQPSRAETSACVGRCHRRFRSATRRPNPSSKLFISRQSSMSEVDSTFTRWMASWCPESRKSSVGFRRRSLL